MNALYGLVREAYLNAIANGYFLDDLTPDYIADDMQAYDAEIEKYDFDAICDVVRRVHVLPEIIAARNAARRARDQK